MALVSTPGPDVWQTLRVIRKVDGVITSTTRTKIATCSCFTQVDETSSPPDETPWVKGVFKITPLSKSKMEVTTSTGFGRVTYRISYNSSLWYDYTWEGGIAGVWTWTTAFSGYGGLLSDDRSLALTGAYAKVNNDVLDLATEIGELRETAAFLASPFKSCTDLLIKAGNSARALLRQRKHPAVTLGDVLDTVGSTHLEIRFALMPLLRSFAAILEEFDRKIMQFNPDRIRVSRRVVRRNTEKILSTAVTAGALKLISHGLTETKQKTRACVFYKLTKPPSRLESYGLSLNDLPSSLWELTPWSFVVDRFINIGDFIRSHLEDPSVVILGDTVAVKKEASGTRTFKPNLQFGPGVFDPGFQVLEWKNYSRTINSGRPSYPVLTTLKTLTNVTHIADHVALIQQLLKAKR